jgi:hypothetical protein
MEKIGNQSSFQIEKKAIKWTTASSFFPFFLSFFLSSERTMHGATDQVLKSCDCTTYICMIDSRLAQDL